MQSRLIVLAVAAAVALAPVPAAGLAVSGHVSDSIGAPIANVQVAFLIAGSSTVAASAITDAAGAYAVAVTAGLYDVRLTPPPDSAFSQQTLPDQSITADVTLDLVLVPTSTGVTVEYSGQVVDRNGAGFSNLPFGPNVTVCTSPGGQPCFGELVDGGGFFSLDVPPGLYELRVSIGSSFCPNAGFLVSRPVDLSADRLETIALQDRSVTGTVVDPGAQPVANAQVCASGGVSFGGFTGNWSNTATSNAGGGFQITALSGTGSVNAVPPSGSGLGQATVPVDATNDVFVNIPLPAGVTVSGQFLDRNGAPPALVQNGSVSLCGNGCSYAVPDALGQFSVAVGPGDYTFYHYGQLAAAPNLVEYNLSRPLTVTGPANQTITIPNRVLSGVLRGPGGVPLANLPITTSWPASFDGFGGTVNGATQSDANGFYSLPILPGSGSLQVVPAIGNGVGRATVAVTVDNDLVLDVDLPQTFPLLVRVRDRASVAPPPTQFAYLCESWGGNCRLSLLDGAGEATYEAEPAAWRVVVQGGYPGSLDHPLGYNFSRQVTTTGAATETITLPNRLVTGTVVDPDGIPVAGVVLSGNIGVPYDGVEWWGSNVGATTDGAGNFSMGVLRGTGALTGTPPSLTGLVPFNIQFTVNQDLTLGIFLQFVTESVAATVPPGVPVTTDTEGDGATPSDPIETSVTAPDGGSIEVSEAPIALAPPGHFTLLTQQIDIIAPDASTVEPLVLVFRLDASRIPPGMNENSLQVLRNGKPVANCSGPSGFAFPDPCVSARIVLMDGDVELTVLTSRASAWHIGVGDLPCVQDTDCTDAVDCTEDVCINGFCALLPDDTLCDNGAVCDGVEQCYPDSGCGPGAPVVCPVDSDPCTDDVCNPATEQCGQPTVCPDDGSPCSVESCDSNTYYGCYSHLTSWADANCEMDQIVAAPICTALDTRLQVKIERKVESARKKIAKLIGVIDVGKNNRGVTSIQRKLSRMMRTVYRFHAKGRIDQPCLDAISLRVFGTMDRIATLYRF